MEAFSPVEQHFQVQQHFDQAPYPERPFSDSGCQTLNDCYLGSIINGFYRKYQKIVQPEGKWILDVGCGSGVTTHKLFEANPGANVIGIDISPTSIAVAKSRFAYHGYDQVQFYAMPAEDLPMLAQMFDYINCHETLYLLPDTLAGLKAMKSVLKPYGIIRANVHSQYARQIFFRSQQLFSFLGLMDDCSLETGIQTVRNLMESLDDSTELKDVWNNSINRTDESITANFLLRGDRGFTIPQTFELLDSAELSFISMVNWQAWSLDRLYKDQSSIPKKLHDLRTSELDKLQLFELINPIHRLIDFWCCHSNVETNYIPPSTWAVSEWQKVQIHINPVLKIDRFTPDLSLKNKLGKTVSNSLTFNICDYLSVNTPDKITLSAKSSTCLFLLLENPQSFKNLLQLWIQVMPLNLETMNGIYEAEARANLIETLLYLEGLSLIMLEM
jgi:ubiquinone/menaquinone biosynthesis C-methylase UbiE